MLFAYVVKFVIHKLTIIFLLWRYINWMIEWKNYLLHVCWSLWICLLHGILWFIKIVFNYMFVPSKFSIFYGIFVKSYNYFDNISPINSWPTYTPHFICNLSRKSINSLHTLRLKSLYTFASVWSKTTLLTGSVGGSGAGPTFLQYGDFWIGPWH